MNKAMVASGFVSSLLVVFATLGAGGCASEEDETGDEELASTSAELSCQRVEQTKVVAGRTIRYYTVKCNNSGDGQSRTPPSNGGSSGANATCTINGRPALCSDGVCRVVNGQPGPNCRFLDGQPPANGQPPPNGGNSSGGAPPGGGGGGGGAVTCTINGRRAVCSDGVCRAVNGQPGPNCRFVD